MTGSMKRATLATGIALDYVEHGPADAPAIIFLHGFPESHRTWRHQIAHLQDRYRCIAPDQRGYRGSSKPAAVSDYTPDKLTADVFALADALGIGRFIVAGHDWGGAIAWIVALHGMANHRVDRLIIANAPHPAIFQRLLYIDARQRAASQYIRGFRDPASDALVAEHGLGGLLARLVGWSADEALEPAERTALRSDWQDRAAAIAMLNWYRASPIDVPAPDEDAAVRAATLRPLPVLTVPTLVIWGMGDTALLPLNLDGMAQQVADLTIVRVPGAGHFVPWQAPAAVNAALDSFLG